jgi:phosphoribosylaminoimidazolecarboxamide formyltransferase / IMP cyclohydrolase
MPRALLSVADKTGIAEFGAGLSKRGFELVSTGGTARALAAAGLPVTPVAEVTGFPEMMDGRVKTLHPKIHGGILARRSIASDLEAAELQDIRLIDLVAVNLYPFVRFANDPATPFERLLEEIDIGGPSLVRAAAKNFRDVLVVVEPDDYEAVLDRLATTAGAEVAFRLELARKAFAHTATYDAAIAAALEATVVVDESFRRGPIGDDRLPRQAMLELRKVRDLRYGENPHQPAAWYSVGDPSALGVRITQGKELSFTNLLDLDASVRLVYEFEEPVAAVIKHTNPCGVASGRSIAEAYVRARDVDPLAAFGGIVALNRAIDEQTASAIVSTFIEAVVAPGVLDEARPVLARKANMRVVEIDPDALELLPGRLGTFRSTFAGVLVQLPDRIEEAAVDWPPKAGRAAESFRVVTRRAPSDEEWRALRFAWRVCAHVKSNAVIFTGEDRTLAVGAGQMSRVDAVRVAIMKAGDPLNRPLAGSVAASDAFFPFRDGLDAIAAAGATAVVQPGGSVRDGEVIDAADEHGLAMVFTGRRHFRH